MPAFNIRLKHNQDTQCSFSQNLCPRVCSDCWLAKKTRKCQIEIHFFFQLVYVSSRRILPVLWGQKIVAIWISHVQQCTKCKDMHSTIALPVGLGLYCSSKRQESYRVVTKISSCRVYTTSWEISAIWLA